MIVYGSMTQLKIENVKLKIVVFAGANEFVGADDHIRPRTEGSRRIRFFEMRILRLRASPSAQDDMEIWKLAR